MISNRVIGFIGLGAMGLPMARNLLRKGWTVLGVDPCARARKDFIASGGRTYEQGQALPTDIDLFVIMARDVQQIDQILFQDGFANPARQGAVVAICSTIAPDDMRRIGQRLANFGLVLVDAPVSGGKIGAVKGVLTIMAAGAKDAYDAIEPALQAMGNPHYLAPEVGVGSTYKVVHQLAAGVHLAAVAEVLALGESAGCDLGLLLEILEQSAGGSWMMQDRGPRMLSHPDVPTSTIDIFIKDLELVRQAGEQAGQELPLTKAALELFRRAQSQGYGRADDSFLIEVYRQGRSHLQREDPDKRSKG
ncbi:MAG: NAD(P)-dependent oxidoreductase [Pseudomonadota bacterium]